MRTCWSGRRPNRPSPTPWHSNSPPSGRPSLKWCSPTSLTTEKANARLARGDVAAEVAELKNQPGVGRVGVGGAGLAASLAEKDLIDEYRLFICPVVLGGGTPYFPPLAKRLNLELIETQTFSQVVYLRYRRELAPVSEMALLRSAFRATTGS